LLNTLRLAELSGRYANRQSIAILQASFKPANAHFQIGTARTQHFRNINTARYRQIAAPMMRGFSTRRCPAFAAIRQPPIPVRPAWLRRRHRSAQTSHRRQTEYHLAERNLQRGGIRALPTSRLATPAPVYPARRSD
jgi:hypothetical protein